MPTIEVKIDREGHVTVEGQNFEKGACNDAIAAVMNGLTVISEEQKEDEVHTIVTV